MGASTFAAKLVDKIKSVWQRLKLQTSSALILVGSASLLCLYGVFAIQWRAQPEARVSSLANSGITHLQLTDWVAEYFACQNGQCKRVLKKLPNGIYEIATEKLPLGRGRYVDNSSFSVRPTHVKLSHRISEIESNQLNKNWPKEAAVIALGGQPVCAENSCRNEDITAPLTKLSIGNKTWIQFDSQVGVNGNFGPQTLPPLIVGLNDVHKIFAQKDFFKNGIFIELAFNLLAPLFALAMTVWVGMPLLYTSFAKFLAARAAWSLFAADALLGEPVLLPFLSTRNSYALAVFSTGWMAVAMVNLICASWTNRNISKERYSTLWAVTSIAALGVTYAFPSAGTSAAVYLRALDSLVLLAGALLSGIAFFALHFTDWNSTLATAMRRNSNIEKSTRSRENLVGLSVIFSAATLCSLWSVFASRGDSSVFNWSSLIIPVATGCVLMYAQPQLTPADIQTQRNFIHQQELLVKLLSQLSSFRHRVQAISLVVNFCNRELPKLGFETPSFSEQRPAPLGDELKNQYEVLLEANVKGSHHSFGWLSARARKRTEITVMGEKIIEALTTALSQHLDTLVRSSQLEREINSAQKFIPHDLMRLFSINSPENIDTQQEFIRNGTAVCVILSTKTRAHKSEEIVDRPLILELSEIFSKKVHEFGGYLVNQEGCRWTLLFSGDNTTSLSWIKSTQIAMHIWNEHRQSLGLTTQELAFGVHSTQLFLKFTDNSGHLRPWITFDTQGVALTLAEVATDYSATTLLSQDFVNSLAISSSSNSLRDEVRPLDRVWNNRKTETVDVYEFFGGDSDARKAAKLRSTSLFSQGIRLYLTGDFEGARSIMSQILESDPHDKAAQRLMGTLSQSGELRAA